MALGLFGQAPSTFAQPPAKPARIGCLGMSGASTVPASLQDLRRGLRELGWVEGNFDRLPVLARELADLMVDVMAAPATRAIEAAQRATATIPIVFPSSRDPVGTGVVASLARPATGCRRSTRCGSMCRPEAR